MSVIRAKLSLDFPDDTKSYYVTISSFEPLVINLPKVDDTLLQLANKITLFWQDGEKRFFCAIKLNGGTLELSGKPSEDLVEYSSHTVDYKGEYSVTPIDFGELTKFLNLSETINRAELSKLASRIEMTINADNNDYPDVMLYLREMNNKLDLIISMMKEEAVIENSFMVRGISLNADIVTLFTKEKIDIDAKYFLTTTLTMPSVNIKFACVCNVRRLDENKYIFEFINLENDVKDEIIRFIFAMERSALKELR